MKQTITDNTIKDIDLLIPDDRVFADVEQMLNDNLPYRAIWPDQSEFPVGGSLEIVVKNVNIWRRDVASLGKFYISVLVALGEVSEPTFVLGEVYAAYGFVEIRYDSSRRMVFNCWTKRMWSDEPE